MTLHDFIKANIERIVDECEAFARTLLPAAAGMDRAALRDHSAQILEAVVRDLARPQTAAEQYRKSLGRAPVDPDAADTAAQTHGALRAASGFNVSQTAAEYRALRASVIRMWLQTGPTLGPDEVSQLTRFNEAMDQALAESLGHFAAAAAHDRNLFLGVLSHELRTPLATISASAHVVERSTDRDAIIDAGARIARGSRRIESVLNDLLDYVRSGAGGGMRVTPASVRVDELVTRVAREIETAFEGTEVELDCSGDMGAVWDEQRIAQAVSNLVTNALKYGAPGSPVRLGVDGTDPALVEISVRNFGPDIPESVRESLFKPLVRGTGPDRTGLSLGLGLYIVREIATAHGGDVTVESPAPNTTVFVMKLKRLCNPMESRAFGTLGLQAR
jgi:signal transduction histidine kinase